MKRPLLVAAMIAVGCAAALPVLADDMNPTDTYAEFKARAAHKYHAPKARHAAKHKAVHRAPMHKVVKKPAKPASHGWFHRGN
jgi:hypothetical protein